MTPAFPSIYKCPHCGALKTICAINSGNSIGIVQWSDLKTLYPMMLKASLVQCCPSCEKYFLRSKDTYYGAANSYACRASWGHLSYPSLREAFEQLSFNNEEEIKAVRIMLMHAHNDLYGGCDGTMSRDSASTEQLDFFSDNAHAIIKLCNQDNPQERLLMAELYREMGQFSNATDILLSPFKCETNALIEIHRYKILKYSEQKNPNVFITYFDTGGIGTDTMTARYDTTISEYYGKCLWREAIQKDDAGHLYDYDFDMANIVEDDLPF